MPVAMADRRSLANGSGGGGEDVHGSLSPALPLAAALNLQCTELRLLISAEDR